MINITSFSRNTYRSVIAIVVRGYGIKSSDKSIIENKRQETLRLQEKELNIIDRYEREPKHAESANFPKEYEITSSMASSLPKGTIFDKKPFPHVMEVNEKRLWCSCGYSHQQPFCDGTHKSHWGGAMIKKMPKYRPLMFKNETNEKKLVYFCNCKRTSTPPFCDGTHLTDEKRVVCREEGMVFYFTTYAPDTTGEERKFHLFMGEDKYENELLIKNCWREDVWFHVDRHSSAHVYIRLPMRKSVNDPIMDINQIPEKILIDCSQLVKANSIEGNKLNNIDVVYTMATNLKKTGDMDVGQVGYYSQKAVKKMRVEKRINEIINRLNKTKIERNNVDFAAELMKRNDTERKMCHEHERNLKQIEKEKELEKEKFQFEHSYDRLHEDKKSTMESNQNNDGNDSDDFM